MNEKLRTLLGIETGEELMVSVLLAQSFFLGVFIGAFDITAHSLFLCVFDEKMMARAYIISGIAGTFLIYIYSRFDRILNFRKYSGLNLYVLAAITLTIWVLLICSHSKLHTFILFALTGPVNLLALPGFWRTTDHFFTTAQGKRMILPSDLGLSIGAFVVSFVIPVLINLKFQITNILLISFFSVTIAALLRIAFVNKTDKTNTGRPTLKEDSDKNKHVSFRFLNDEYLSVIGIYVAISVLVSLFIHYIFMAVVRVQYPSSEELAVFLGVFTGILITLTVFLRLIVFTRLLQNFGMRTCLLVSPLAIICLTAVLVISGLSAGYTQDSALGFILFLILLTIIKLISKSLKDSVEIRSIKVIFQSVNVKTKSVLRQDTTGTINEIMILVSGLILTGAGLLGFIRLIHFAILLLILSLIWICAAIKLYKAYRSALLKITVKEDMEEEKDINGPGIDFKNRLSAWLTFRSDYFNLLSGKSSFLDRTENTCYFEEIINQAEGKNDINLVPALKKIAENTILDFTIRHTAAQLSEKLREKSNLTGTDKGLMNEAVRILSGTRLPQTTDILKLIRENSVASKRLAIFLIGKFRLADLLTEACECLSTPDLSTDIYEVLKSFGTDAEDRLIGYYLKTSGNQRLNGAILRLLENLCSKESAGFLYSRLWSNSRKLKEIAANGLVNCRYKPSTNEKLRLDALISDVLGNITWNLSAKASLGRDQNLLLSGRFDNEINRWDDLLFKLLSIAYDPSLIRRIRKESGINTLESVSYALEIIVATVSDKIKPLLISYIDFVPEDVRLNNLLHHFTGQVPGPEKLIEDIINCDFNLISSWTKACALRSISKIDGNDLAESVTALLFSPEEIIREESAGLIARSDKNIYISAIERIPGSFRLKLDDIVNGTADSREILFEKTLFLSKCFIGIPEDELLLLAMGMKLFCNFDTETLKTSVDSIVWLLNSNNEPEKVYILIGGTSNNMADDFLRMNGGTVYKIGLSAIEEFHFQFPESTWKILKYFENNEEENRFQSFPRT